MLVDVRRGGDGSAGGYGYCCGQVGEAFAYMKKLYYLCNRNKEGGNTLPQLSRLEHLTVNQRVLGSSPRGRASPEYGRGE